ncbi:MAG: TIGR02147 family protein [bacterium]
MEKKKVSVFDYTDYRRYLADYYTEQKEINPSFSYRYFAQKAGYNSSGMYKDIVSGRTNIKPGFIAKLSKAIRHGKREEEYFETMVLFNQAGGS